MKRHTRTKLACGTRNLILLSRFPQGKAGAGTVPPQEGFQGAPLESPLRDPPTGFLRVYGHS